MRVPYDTLVTNNFNRLKINELKGPENLSISQTDNDFEPVSLIKLDFVEAIETLNNEKSQIQFVLFYCLLGSVYNL